jgi:hypothetical protein
LCLSSSLSVCSITFWGVAGEPGAQGPRGIPGWLQSQQRLGKRDKLTFNLLQAP